MLYVLISSLAKPSDDYIRSIAEPAAGHGVRRRPSSAGKALETAEEAVPAHRLQRLSCCLRGSSQSSTSGVTPRPPDCLTGNGKTRSSLRKRATTSEPPERPDARYLDLFARPADPKIPEYYTVVQVHFVDGMQGLIICDLKGVVQHRDRLILIRLDYPGSNARRGRLLTRTITRTYYQDSKIDAANPVGIIQSQNIHAFQGLALEEPLPVVGGSDGTELLHIISFKWLESIAKRAREMGLWQLMPGAEIRIDVFDLI
ncbi:MAG: hypothetical protein M1829_001422 [Trizodia sp. TS-e1964]|nr:MAG: hypothetical protein M1829_001422 [Trizodia sp. TS-e1964]